MEFIGTLQKSGLLVGQGVRTLDPLGNKDGLLGPT